MIYPAELTYNQFIQLNHIRNLSDREKMLYYNMHLNELTAIRLYHISEQNRVMAIRGSGNTTIETEEDIFEGNLLYLGGNFG